MPASGGLFDVLPHGIVTSTVSGSPFPGLLVCTGWFEEAQKFLNEVYPAGTPATQAKTRRRTLLFRAGYAYMLPANATLMLTKEENGLLGEGPGSLIFRNGTQSAPLVLIKDAKEIGIRALTFETTSTSLFSSACIEVSGNTEGVGIENVRCAHAKAGIKLSEGTDIRIVDCELYNCIHNIELGTPSSTPQTQNVLISGCILRDSKLPENINQNALSSGLHFRGPCANIVLNGNTIKDNKRNGVLSSARIEHILFSNNNIHDNKTNGIEIQQGMNIVLQANLLVKNGDCGIKIQPKIRTSMPYNILLVSNQITDNGADGLDSQAEYVSVLGNQFTSNGRTISPSNVGIRFRGRSNTSKLQNGIISNNIIENNGWDSGQSAGILCEYADNIQINNNILSLNLDLLQTSTPPKSLQKAGILLQNSNDTLLTGNSFEGYQESTSKHPPVYTLNATYTSANNIGLKNRKALANYVFEERRKFIIKHTTKPGELVYAPDKHGLMFYDSNGWTELATIPS